MAKKSIAPDEETVEEKETEETMTPDTSIESQILEEVAEDQTRSIVPAQTMELGKISGDLKLSTVRVPWLGIAHGVGQLMGLGFNPGDIVLNKKNALASRDNPLTVVILSSALYWKERLDREQLAAKLIPRKFEKEEEAHEAGLTTRWEPNDAGIRVAPGASEAMDFKLLIQQPEGMDGTLFGLEFGGKNWTPAMFSVDKSGFSRVGQPFLQAASYQLTQVGYTRALWSLWTETQNLKGNPTIVPMLRLDKLMDEDVHADILSTFSSVNTVIEDQ